MYGCSWGVSESFEAITQLERNVIRSPLILFIDVWWSMGSWEEVGGWVHN